MPIIKHIAKQDYTIVDNVCLRDRDLDLDCRGLLITMLSLPENWDFSGRGLSAILPCGKSKIYKLLNKLEKAGYIKREELRDSKGRIADTAYYVASTPMFKEEEEQTEELSEEIKTEEPQVNTDKNSKMTEDLSGKVQQKHSQIKENNCSLPCAENPDTVNPDTANPCTDNRDSNKIYNNKLNTNKLNNNKYQSIYQSNKQAEYITKEKMGRLIDNTSKASENLFEDYKNIIKRNVEYDILTDCGKSVDTPIVDEIINIMTDVVAFAKNPIIICGEKIPANIVQKRFLALKQFELQYVLESLNSTSVEIKNIRSYLIAALYNSASTQHLYYQNKVNYNFQSGG